MSTEVPLSKNCTNCGSGLRTGVPADSACDVCGHVGMASAVTVTKVPKRVKDPVKGRRARPDFPPVVPGLGCSPGSGKQIRSAPPDNAMSLSFDPWWRWFVALVVVVLTAIVGASIALARGPRALPPDPQGWAQVAELIRSSTSGADLRDAARAISDSLPIEQQQSVARLTRARAELALMDLKRDDAVRASRNTELAIRMFDIAAAFDPGWIEGDLDLRVEVLHSESQGKDSSVLREECRCLIDEFEARCANLPLAQIDRMRRKSSQLGFVGPPEATTLSHPKKGQQ